MAIAYYAHYFVDDTWQANHPIGGTWQARCTCGWRGEWRTEENEQAAKEEATCHTIETGHCPAWEQLREEQ